VTASSGNPTYRRSMPDEAVHPAAAAHRRSWPHVFTRFGAGAPVMFTWLTLLAMTTVVQNVLPRMHLRELLHHESTNLHHLAANPIRVLITSLFWIDGYAFWPYLLMFVLVLAPAERRLGSLRFVIVGLTAHVLATYLSEGYLYWQIQEAVVSPRYLNARDVGVSYFIVGIIGVLTYFIARPWRWLYLGFALVWFAVPVAVSAAFTPVGHLAALLVGLAWYPLTRGRGDPQWAPDRLMSRLRRRRRTAA